MWPLKGKGGRQVAVGHFIVLIDITGKFFVAFCCGWLQGLFIFITETFYWWWLVSMFCLLYLLTQLQLTPVCHTYLISVFLIKVCRAFPFVWVALSCIHFLSGLLGHEKVWARKIIVHRIFVSCTFNYMCVIFLTAVFVAFMFPVVVRNSWPKYPSLAYVYCELSHSL